MDKPKARQLMDALGISSSYAHMILSGQRTPPFPLAVRIYRATGWRAPNLADLSEEQIDALEAIPVPAAAA